MDGAANDWDITIVGDVPSAHNTSLYEYQYDIVTTNLQDFLERVKQGSIKEVVLALMRKEDMIQCAFDTCDLEINPDSLKPWSETSQVKNLAKAETCWLNENQQKGWKILRYIIMERALCNHSLFDISSDKSIFPFFLHTLHSFTYPYFTKRYA